MKCSNVCIMRGNNKLAHAQLLFSDLTGQTDVADGLRSADMFK